MSHLIDLPDGSVEERVAYLHDLSLIGVPGDIPELIERACDDASPAVRLAAATTAAAILSRHRVGPLGEAFDARSRRELLQCFGGIDPGWNPGMFLALGALGIPEALQRIGVGLRDPRAEVRAGAFLGLRRYLCSHATVGDTTARSGVLELLASGRLPPDSEREVALVGADLGWPEVGESLLDSGMAKGPLAEEKAAARERLVQVQDADGLHGIWMDRGRDAEELGSDQATVEWLILDAEGGAWGPAGALSALEWSTDDAGHVGIGTPQARDARPCRRIWTRCVRSTAQVQALQIPGRTYFRADADAAETIVLGMLQVPLPAGSRETTVARLLTQLPETARGDRLRARLLIACGAAREASVLLQARLGRRKQPAADLYFLLGEAHAAAGFPRRARTAWKNYLARAGKRGAHRAAARERLDTAA